MSARAAPSPSPQVVQAHRRAQRKVIGHLLFVGLGCVIALLLRKVFHLPPLLGWTIFAAAFVVFAQDIIRWLYCRHQLRRHQAASQFLS